jgi:hypothetical protein
VSELRVIDLDAQAVAVAKHIQGWEKDSILSWLRRYGELEPAHPGNPNAYLFRSFSGITTGFVLGENGKLTIVGDHTTRTIAVDQE